MSDNTPPIETLRDGNIKASLWVNEGDNGPFITTTIARTYTDQKGQVRDTTGFTGTDLLRVAELARVAYQRSGELRRELTQDHSRQNGRGGPSRDFARSRSNQGPRRTR
ncbi:MAG: hypothetical protein AAGJ51_09075 [Pseudomonadota bacterium]